MEDDSMGLGLPDVTGFILNIFINRVGIDICNV